MKKLKFYFTIFSLIAGIVVSIPVSTSGHLERMAFVVMYLPFLTIGMVIANIQYTKKFAIGHYSVFFILSSAGQFLLLPVMIIFSAIFNTAAFNLFYIIVAILFYFIAQKFLLVEVTYRATYIYVIYILALSFLVNTQYEYLFIIGGSLSIGLIFDHAVHPEIFKEIFKIIKPNAMQQQNSLSTFSNWIKTSITFKMIVVGAMVIVLIVPMIMISGLIDEREQLQQEAIRDIGSKWGGSQYLIGPILALPYKELTGSGENKSEIVKTAYFLPEKLNITGTINPETLNRGIYDVTVYNANLNFSGNYSAPDLASLKIDSSNVLWSDAYFCIGISDLKGIKRTVDMKYGDKNFVFKNGIIDENLKLSGVSAGVSEEQTELLKTGGEFSFAIDINGSSNLNFAPLGKETDVNLSSQWSNPGFDGTFLPDKREITEAGFNAEWKVLNLNRGFPQQWIGDSFSPASSGFGVNLLQPVEQYQKISRSAKYAFLFIFLTYVVFFFVEVINKTRIHPIRYFLVGLALIIFYTLLLSISEVIGFEMAYLAAASAVVILITLYSKNFLKKWILTGFMFLILSFLYGFLYFIIQLQDYSLLAGSIGLFIILAILMYFSRKINYENGSPKEEQVVTN